MKGLMIFFLSLYLISNAFACIKMEGSIEIDGEELVFNQKVETNKDYSFAQKKYLYHLKVLPAAKGHYELKIDILEKEKNLLKDVTHARIFIKENEPAVMTKEDDKTKLVTVVQFKLTHI